MPEQFSEHITDHETQKSHGFGVTPEKYGTALHKQLSDIQAQEQHDTLNELQDTKNEQQKQLFLKIQQQLLSADNGTRMSGQVNFIQLEQALKSTFGEQSQALLEYYSRTRENYLPHVSKQSVGYGLSYVSESFYHEKYAPFKQTQDNCPYDCVLFASQVFDKRLTLLKGQKQDTKTILQAEEELGNIHYYGTWNFKSSIQSFQNVLKQYQNKEPTAENIEKQEDIIWKLANCELRFSQRSIKHNKAIQYTKKAIEINIQLMKNTPSEAQLARLMMYYNFLVKVYHNMEHTKNVIQEIQDIATKQEQYAPLSISTLETKKILAELAKEEGDFDGAKKIYETIFAKFNNIPFIYEYDLYFQHARNLLEKKDFLGAHSKLSKVFEDRYTIKTDFETKFDTGIKGMGMGYLGYVINLDGEILTKMGDYQEALLRFDEILGPLKNPSFLEPLLFDTHLNKVNTLIEMQQKQGLNKNQNKDLENTRKAFKDMLYARYYTWQHKNTQENNQMPFETFLKRLEKVIEGAIYSNIASLAYKSPEKFQTELKKIFGERFTFVKTLEGDDGFSGYLIQDENNTKIFVFRGSEFTKLDIQDIAEDAKIGLGFVPGDQIEAMIEKIDGEITKDEKVIFVGHSLGGALAQIATSMYSNNVLHSYAFNAPGTQKLEVIESSIGEKYKEKFKRYTQEKQNPELKQTLTNYDSQEWVAQMGIDIGEIFSIDNTNHAIDAGNETLERVYTPSVASKLGRGQYAQMEKVLQFLKYENVR